MADDDPTPEASAWEAVTTANASRQPDEAGPALAGESAAGSGQTTATIAKESAAAPPPTEASTAGSASAPPPTGVTTGDVVGTSISLLFLLISLFCLIYFHPSSRMGTAALILLFIACFTAVFVYGVSVVSALGPRWKRWKRAKLIPAGVGAAVIAAGLLVGVMQILPIGDAGSSATHNPSESTVSTAPSSSPEPTASERAQEVQPPAVKSCIKQVKALSEEYSPTPGADLTGRVWVTSTRATTVVVADSQATWACNLEPDIATSTAGKATIGYPEAEDFSIAYWQDSDGTFAWWGGGALPAGVESLKFTFPDGIEVYAETRDGYWVMQHLTRTDYKWDDHKPIVVRVTSPIGYRGTSHYSDLRLRWGDDTCDQVNHGC